MAAGTHADRIHHKGEGLSVKDIGQRVDDAGVEEHTRLRAVDGEAVQHGAELERGESGFGSVDARHTEAVLRRERGDDTHAEGTHSRHGLEVGLNTGSAAGIGARNGEDIRGLYHGSFLFA